MRQIALALAIVLGTAVKATSLPVTCESLVQTHGLLSRAQFQCRFNGYNNQMIEAVRRCAHDWSKKKFEKVMLRGFNAFDEAERRFGHAAACETLLKMYPDVIRK